MTLYCLLVIRAGSGWQGARAGGSPELRGGGAGTRGGAPGTPQLWHADHTITGATARSVADVGLPRTFSDVSIGTASQPEDTRNVPQTRSGDTALNSPTRFSIPVSRLNFMEILPSVQSTSRQVPVMLWISPATGPSKGHLGQQLRALGPEQDPSSDSCPAARAPR